MVRPGRRRPAGAGRRAPASRRAGGRRRRATSGRRAGPSGRDHPLDEQLDRRRRSSSRAVRSSRPARSTHTGPGPLTITSLTAGSASSGSSGPSPPMRARTRTRPRATGRPRRAAAPRCARASARRSDRRAARRSPTREHPAMHARRRARRHRSPVTAAWRQPSLPATGQATGEQAGVDGRGRRRVEPATSAPHRRADAASTSCARSARPGSRDEHDAGRAQRRAPGARRSAR